MEGGGSVKRKSLPWSGGGGGGEVCCCSLIDFFACAVPQVKGFEICEVKEEAGLYKVTLNAGHLHGVVEGEYDVCRPEIPNETAASRNREKIYRYCIDTIAINRGEIDMLRSRGSTAYKSDDRKIRVSTLISYPII